VRRDDERLADIIEAADKIAVRAAKGRAAFDADEDTQIVLVHLIQVIGEAASGLSDGFVVQHPEVPWRQIIATRNRVVHGYTFSYLNDQAGTLPGESPRLIHRDLRARSRSAAMVLTCWDAAQRYAIVLNA
jgi:uncharacterized protein with HEPN domain